MTSSPCPDHGMLQELLAGELRGEKLAELQAHLDDCPHCDQVVVQLVEDTVAETATRPAAAQPHDETRREGAGPESSPRPDDGRHDEASGLHEGTQVGDYEVVSLLGHGAMGEVYRARDNTLGRDVALKVIRSAADLPRDAVARFIREAKAVARFNHPNIVSIYAAGRHDGMPFVALELVRGATLDAWRDGRSLDEAQISDIGVGIARALTEAHRHGVIHRDLKPANVMVGDDGRIRVLDFGLAMVVHVEEAAPLSGSRVGRALVADATSVSGTPRYMAPEQWRRGKLTGAADVWALGVILFELWAGRPPLSATSLDELRTAATDTTPVPRLSDVTRAPEPWVELVADCLRRDPEDRPFAKEVLSRLEAIASTGAESLELAATAPADALEPGSAPSPRPRVLAAVAIAGVAAVAFALSRRPTEGPAPAAPLSAPPSATASSPPTDEAPDSSALKEAWAALGAGRHEDAARAATAVLAQLDAEAGRLPRGAPPNPTGAAAQRVLTRVALARARAHPDRAEEYVTEAELACERATSWSPQAESACCKTDLADHLSRLERLDEAMAQLGDVDFAASSCAEVAAAIRARGTQAAKKATKADETEPSGPAVTPAAPPGFDLSTARQAGDRLVPRAKAQCSKVTGARTVTFTVSFLNPGLAEIRGSAPGETGACVRSVLARARVAPFSGRAAPFDVTVALD